MMTRFEYKFFVENIAVQGGVLSFKSMEEMDFFLMKMSNIINTQKAHATPDAEGVDVDFDAVLEAL